MHESAPVSATVSGKNTLASMPAIPAIPSMASMAELSTGTSGLSGVPSLPITAALHAAPAVRNLLYIAQAPNQTLVSYLKDRGWKVSAGTLATQASVLKTDTPVAGIVDMVGFSARELAALEPALRHQQAGWIALTDDTCLADPVVCHMIRHYCFDFVKGPVAHATIGYLVDHAYGMVSLGDIDLADTPTVFGDEQMVGTCEAMQQLFRTIRKVANTDANVFITGESGTGKELTAVAIHERSPRRKGPFVAINCGAIGNDLIQSELFGYERGAFTGAHQRKIGRVEEADGGTLFLDEIGDLPIDSQVHLLRFLQERKIDRLGGHDPVAVDVRIISATHIDLDAAMASGRFRTDLFHRLCVLRVDEPPLRARGKDIEILALHVLHKFKSDGRRKIRGFAPSAIEAMYSYAWTGNVREMINRVRRAIVMAENKLITADDLGLGHCTGIESTTLAAARDAAEKRAIELTLLRHRHRLSEAAAELGISRVTLYRLMVAHGLRGATAASGADVA
ncbi:sigma-54 dependent transcriptional regulator [Caballeronia sp. SEWSISQ10-4 2]|uniref:sigma-54 dependent transcriptional regulator n=1 Tax=Caballeronia sp. SEWSISQ10-4 2 TaxID=2937438 RepID=UPI002651A4FE|nr:sigma-54 dependent transcriptional regulator [Caballeronia sp. SEWSISQ10-4 2]MDN7177896.1 sigma-54 dependent transcriptional regulator [Caballeronia sp. SEWSISQ10-4 2]